MKLEDKILQKLDSLSEEVAALKALVNQQTAPPKEGAVATQVSNLPQNADAQQELLDQIASSSTNLTKLVKTLDQMVELKEDMVPLSKPMLEGVIEALDQATHGFDSAAFKELVRQFVLNLSSLSEAIKMVGGLIEFRNDSAQITKDAFEDTIVRLEGLKQKGFFDAMWELLQMAELIRQKLQGMDMSKTKPIKGVFGLYNVTKQKDFQEGLGILVELVSAVSVLKQKPIQTEPS